MPESTRIVGSLVTFLIFVACQPLLIAQQPLWGLQTGNQFAVETTIERATTLQIDGGSETTTSVKEIIELLYTVNNVRPTGIVIEVRVTKAIRVGKSGQESSDNTADQQLESLKGFRSFILVAPDGVVTNIAGRLDSLRQLAGPDPLSMDLLSATCTDNVMTSWLGYPFWMTAPDETLQNDTEWQRVDELSLGLMGSLRVMTTCTIDSMKEQQIGVKISGSGRHVSNLAASDNSNTLISFVNTQATVERFEGSGKMVIPKRPEDDNNTELRPWFESLSLEWQITGKSTVVSTGQEKALSFRQTRKQISRLLPGYRVGRRRLIPREELFLNRPQ